MIVAEYGIIIGACPPEFLSIGAVIMITTALATTLAVKIINKGHNPPEDKQN